MRALMLCVLFALSGCASRSESMVYTSTTLPPWILQEWRNAQEELLRLPGIPEDPRRYSPYQWNWVQLDTPFYDNVGSTSKRELYGVTDHTNMQIIICCGKRETVRHEAFHAILGLMHDPRYKVHYPQLKKELQ